VLGWPLRRFHTPLRDKESCRCLLLPCTRCAANKTPGYTMGWTILQFSSLQSFWQVAGHSYDSSFSTLLPKGISITLSTTILKWSSRLATRMMSLRLGYCNQKMSSHNQHNPSFFFLSSPGAGSKHFCSSWRLSICLAKMFSLYPSGSAIGEKSDIIM
jgi:hypothetical protein